MAYRKRPSRAPKRRVAKRKGNRKGKKSGHLNTRAPQFARIVETVNIQDAPSNTLNTLGFCLNDFNRARFESNNWQFFKAAKVTWTYEPLYNTYQDGTGTALSKPYLYTRMNRTQDKVIPFGLGGLQGAGAMPKAMVSTIKQTYRPNWNIQGLTIGSQPSGGSYGVAALGARCEYGWINNSPYLQTQYSATSRLPGQLNPSQTGAVSGILSGTTVSQVPSYCLYNGHDFYIDQKNADPTATAPICRITMTVEWHFKGPVYNEKIVQTRTDAP